MGLLGDIGNVVGGVFGGVKDTLDAWNGPQEQKDKILGDIEKAEQQIRNNLIQAELKQDDLYTKRARPTVVYAGILIAMAEMLGLRFLFLNWANVSADVITASTQALNVFWMAWGGVVGLYAGGRTAEKLGLKRK